ncbi:MAG: hypothetical protein ACWA45_08775 [Flavobacteriales bacterium]
MKAIKLLFFSLSLVLLTTLSCTNDQTLIKVPEIQESASLQSALNRIDNLIDENGHLIAEENPTNNLFFDFCFEFVYPITLIYNTGTTVDVNSFDDLIAVIIGSTEELYIVGIEFPFQVEVYNQNDNETQIITINNEEEFIALLESCNFDESCECTDEYDPVCVEINDNGETITITFGNACLAECEGFTEDQYFECDGCDCPDEYDPVCVETEGAIIEFGNACLAECEGFTEEDFVECEDDGCNCPDEYDPVCVENPTGDIIAFDNFCLAECEGYTQQDLVNCENEEECEISNLSVEVGDCNEDGSYTLTINFDYANTNGQEYFDLYVRNNELIGYFPLADLPLTIDNFERSDFEEDFIKVCINDNSDCCQEIEWQAPDCTNNNGECQITNLEVEVGDCNPTGTYQLTINFDYENTNGQEYFDLYVRNNELIGYFPLADLPLTIDNFERSDFEEDFIKVCINDNSDCCQEIEWQAPNCEDSCYEYVFPILLSLEGTTVAVNSNEEVDQYLEEGYNLVYPIDIIVNEETITVMQGILEGSYGPRCED